MSQELGQNGTGEWKDNVPSEIISGKMKTFKKKKRIKEKKQRQSIPIDHCSTDTKGDQ